MEWIVGLLGHTLTTVAGQPVTWVEAFGFISGALCVWAVARQYSWNWPVGIASNVVFFVLFVGYGLYADAALQVAFLALGIYGWITWSRRGRVIGMSTVPIRRVTLGEAINGILIAALTTAGVALLLMTFTNSTVPWPDAFVLAFSLLATWGQARKILEQWWVWIAVDVVSIPLYAYKGLWLTAVLYCGFLGLCVYGLRRWRAEYRADELGADAEPQRIAANGAGR
jgi:nicotinamide mononucleotide transporter